MSLDAKLKQLVEREAQELAAAPIVPSANMAVRCHFCGQLARSIQLVEIVGGQERWKGECCAN